MTSELTPLEYWSRTVADPTWPDATAAMLQDSDAHAYDVPERDATLALLPSGFLGSHGVELGCGVGRYTVHLAGRVDHLLAIDLIRASVEATRTACSRSGVTNVSLQASDAADYHPDAGTVDLMFVKWVLMYLDDTQADALIRRVAKALRPGGVLLVHDSADPAAHPSPDGSYARFSAEYPGRYRHPDWYDRRLRAAAPWRSVHRGDIGWVYTDWNYPPGAQPVWVLTRGEE